MLSSSFWSFSSAKMTIGSRMNRCEMCLARRWSIPEEYVGYKPLMRDAEHSYHDPEDVCRSPGHLVPRCRCTPAGSTSCRRYTTRQSRTGTWGYGICCSSKANDDVMTEVHRQTSARTFRPRSSSVRSSTLPEMTFHLASTSVM